MNYFSTITRHHLDQYFSEQESKVLTMIALALTAGVTFFVLISIVLIEDAPIDSKPDSIIDLLAILTIIVSIGVYLVFQFLPKILISESKFDVNPDFKRLKSATEEQSVQTLSAFYRTYMIVKLAVLESATLIGLVGFFQVCQDGLLSVNSMYWLFLIPYGIQIGYTLINFPTYQRQIDDMEFLIKHRFNLTGS